VISENRVSLPRREREKSKPPHLYPLPQGERGVFSGRDKREEMRRENWRYI
jgi:hypothetical protein